MLLWLYATALFTGSALLFWIQPMFSKMALPLLGGAPSVWTASMVFYQAALLSGYAFTHWFIQRWGVRRHSLVHLGLFGLALLTLSFTLPDRGPTFSDHPMVWLFLLHIKSIGLPFAVIACTAPMLQKWFERTAHPSANDPYFLYAASNAGSLSALLAYPLFLEPLFPLAWQNRFWSAGCVVLFFLIIACAVVMWRSSGNGPFACRTNVRTSQETVSVVRRARWVMLAFVPSSLLLGVTTYITTDIAAIPLLWVIPLAIYLLTFILTFARRPIVSHSSILKYHAFWVLPPVFLFFSPLKLHAGLDFPIHLTAFFLAAMVCHGELVRNRPHPDRLTQFYLWISVGGVCGGIFNALLAPAVFNLALEYPLAIMFACMLRPRKRLEEKRGFKRGVIYGLCAALLLLLIGPSLGNQATTVNIGLFGLALASSVIGSYCIDRIERPVTVGLIFLVMTGIDVHLSARYQPVIHRDRSFFGPMQIRYDARRDCYLFNHGTTLHGVQSRDPERRGEPLSYYHRSGPFSQIVETLNRYGGMKRSAVVGLGVGVIGAYSQPGQEMTFYEIDPAVERVARDSRYFTFLDDSPARTSVVIGDARLAMKHAPRHAYDSIFLDAFSSGSIPTHLLTEEAMTIYTDKLTEDGFLIFQISNRYLDLEPVLANLAHTAGMTGTIRKDLEIGQDEEMDMKVASVWTVMTRQPKRLETLTGDPRWKPLSNPRNIPLWTDDYSNILRVLKRPTFSLH